MTNPPRTDAAERPTAVYRFFDRKGRLLYVGIAYDPADRWKQHAREARWWDQAADNTIDWYDTRGEAERAELTALRYEKPVFNQRDSARPYQGPTKKRGLKLPRKVAVPDDVWADYQQICEEEGTTPEADLTRHVGRRIKTYRAELRNWTTDQP